MRVSKKNLEYVYQQEGIYEFSFIFLEYISYSNFISLVKMKTGLLDRYKISLPFHHPKLHHYIVIVDNIDVIMLINIIKSVGGKPMKMVCGS